VSLRLGLRLAVTTWFARPILIVFCFCASSSRDHILQSLVTSPTPPNSSPPSSPSPEPAASSSSSPPEVCSTYQAAVYRGSRIWLGFNSIRESILDVVPGMTSVIKQATAGTEQTAIDRVVIKAEPKAVDQVKARVSVELPLKSMEYVEKVYAESGRLESTYTNSFHLVWFTNSFTSDGPRIPLSPLIAEIPETQAFIASARQASYPRRNNIQPDFRARCWRGVRSGMLGSRRTRATNGKCRSCFLVTRCELLQITVRIGLG
jgi:hypothetical protein